jgi:hypothetical protein
MCVAANPFPHNDLTLGVTIQSPLRLFPGLTLASRFPASVAKQLGSHIIEGLASLPPQRYQLRIKRPNSKLGVGVVPHGKRQRTLSAIPTGDLISATWEANPTVRDEDSYL